MSALDTPSRVYLIVNSVFHEWSDAFTEVMAAVQRAPSLDCASFVHLGILGFM